MALRCSASPSPIPLARRRLCGVIVAATGVLLFAGAAARGQNEAEAKDMNLLGYNDLQGRSAYQPSIEKQGDRFIAYIGHHAGTKMNPMTGKMEVNGTSIVDVTDPSHPTYLAHIPGEPSNTQGGGESGGAQMTRVCTGLPHADKSKFFLLRSYGNSAQEIWDVTDPAKPTRVTVVESGLRDTHKNWWECGTGIAYLVSGVPDWRGAASCKFMT